MIYSQLYDNTTLFPALFLSTYVILENAYLSLFVLYAVLAISVSVVSVKRYVTLTNFIAYFILLYVYCTLLIKGCAYATVCKNQAGLLSTGGPLRDSLLVIRQPVRAFGRDTQFRKSSRRHSYCALFKMKPFRNWRTTVYSFSSGSTDKVTQKSCIYRIRQRPLCVRRTNAT